MHDFGIVRQQRNRPRRDRVSAGLYEIESAPQRSPSIQHLLVVTLSRCVVELDDDIYCGIRIEILKFLGNLWLAGERHVYRKDEDCESGQLFNHSLCCSPG